MWHMFLFIFVFINNIPHVLPCTMIGVGKKATADGSVFITHSDDAGGGTSDVRLLRIPAADYPPDSLRPVYELNNGYPRLVTQHRGPAYQPVDHQAAMKPLGHIPQLSHTYAYWDQDYGLMNEHQLAIGESTSGSKFAGWSLSNGGKNMFMIEELSKIALERCMSARCAIQTMGALAEEYGFFGDSGLQDDPAYTSSAETLGIADKFGEVWIFHIMTGPKNSGAIWVARRVPDNHLTVVANAFTIRNIDLNDPLNYMACKNVVSAAIENGFYDPELDGPFDFTRAYAPIPNTTHIPLYVGRRMWRVLDLAAPTLQLDYTLGWSVLPTYPWSVEPEAKVSLQFLMRIYRDHYEGTVFDMTKGIAAGPFGNPNRWDGDGKGVQGSWEREISMFRTTFSFIANPRIHLRDELGGLFWYGQGSPHGTVYVPVYGSQRELPKAYAQGKQSKFSTDSAWWAFGFLNNWCQLRYDQMMQDVRGLQGKLEKEGWDLTQALEAQGLMESEALVALVSTTAAAHAQHVVTSWWNLAWAMVGKYIDGYITTGETEADRQQPGYPAWWLEATDFHSNPEHIHVSIPLRPVPHTVDLLTVASPQPDHAPDNAFGSTAHVVTAIGLCALGVLLLISLRRKPRARNTFAYERI